MLDEELYYCMDYELWMKLFLNYKSLKVNTVFSRFREHSSSKTNSKPIQLYLEYQKVVSRFFNSLPQNTWRDKLAASGIQYDLSGKKYALKQGYTEAVLAKVYGIYLQKSLNIEYTKRNVAGVNALFFKNLSLLFDVKSLFTFIKINTVFLFSGKKND